MCSSRRSTEKGYALMLAMVLAATVLGGSALILQRSAAQKREMVRKERAMLLDSALQSIDAMLQRRLFWRDGRLVETVDLGPVQVTLAEQPGDNKLLRSVMVTAKAGNTSRQVVRAYQRGLALKVACIGCPPGPGMDIHGGIGAGEATSVAELRRIIVLPDLCVVTGPTVELPPAQCDGKARIRIESDGPLVLRHRTGAFDETSARLISIQAKGSVRFDDAITLPRAIVHLAAPSVETAKNAPFTLHGGLLLEVPQVSVDPSSRWDITADEPTTEELLSPPVDGYVRVPPAFCVD